MCCGSHNHSGNDASSKRSKMPIVISLVGLAAVVGILVYAGQGPRLLSGLPFLLLLACPLMHLFMGMGHRGHAQAPQETKEGENRRNCH